MNIFSDNGATIGGTPLVRLNRCLNNSGATVLAKIESRNPAGSVKCRVGAALIADAQSRGLLTDGVEIIEPTSGNTGIGLAYVAAAKGLPLTLVMPEDMSIERRKLLAYFGAKIILSPADQGMAGSVALAGQIVADHPGKYFTPQQFKNPANPAIHEQTTAPELWDATDGKIDILVAGVGTGGTLTGIARYFKKRKNVPLWVVAVEPEESPVIRQALAGEKPTPKPHGLQGIGAGFIPDTLDLTLVDESRPASLSDALAYAKKLAKEEGICAGISSGAALSVAAQLAHEAAHKDKTIVVILPDSAERYLSTALFAG